MVSWHNTSTQAAVFTPWGIWATAGFSLIIVVAFLLTQIVASSVLVAMELRQNPALDIDVYSQSLATNGLLLAVATCGGMLTTVVLVGIFVRLRKPVTLMQYLHFYPIAMRALVGWLSVVLILALLWDLLTFLLGRPVVPAFMIAAYQSAGFAPLFWIALVVAAPVSEEVFFRGFLFEGIRCTRLGSAGAVIVTSLGWALVHLQYDMYEMTTVFVLGVVLALARLRTNSLYTTIAMHALVNFLATLEAAVYVRQLEAAS
jgi:membrane protease YdiL (CAAX protease family)